MAKNNRFETGNDFDFDSGFGDIPDFAAPKDRNQNKRTPVLSLGKAALEGAVGRSGLMDESFIRRTVRSSLPSGYGVALDVADEASSTLRSLYNDSARTLKPLINDMKRVVGRMEEPLDKYLPKSVSQGLNRWSKSLEQGVAGADPEAQREAMIQASVAEALKHQIVQDAKREQRDDAKGKIREQIDQIRHKDSMGQLNEIRKSASQLAAYQNNVTANYHRKSLELQYRTFFTLKDMAIEQKRMSEVTTAAFERIVKNTGLPDYVKMTDSDRLGQATRNRFGKLFDSGIGAARREFLRNFGKNIQKVVGGRVQNFAYGASSALSAVDDGADALKTLQEMQGMGIEGVSPQEMAANMAGGMFAQHLGGRAVNWAKKKLGAADPNSRAGRFTKWGQRQANRITYQANNLQTNAKKFANGYGDLPGALGKLPGFIQDIIRETIQMDPGYDRTLQKDKLSDMQGPAIFSRQVAKSITEIIPGYLARILREVQITRTGDETTELLRYDFSGNKFVNHTQLRKSTFEGAINKDNARSFNSDVDKLIKEIDPNDKLSAPAKMDLRKQLVRDNVRGVSGVAEHYQDPMNISSRHSYEIADHFSDRYSDKNDQSYAARTRFSAQHGALGGNIAISRSTMQDHANAGNLDLLESLGLVDKYGNIDPEKIAEYHLEGGTIPGAVGAATGGGRRTPRRRAGTGRSSAAQRGAGIRHTAIYNQQTYNPAATEHRDQNYSLDIGGLIEAVKANNNIASLAQLNETMLRIEHELQTGLIVHQGTGAEGGDPGTGKFLDRSLRQNFNRGKAGLRSGAQQAWDWWKKPGLGAKLWGDRGKHWQATKTGAAGLWDKVKTKYADMKEVYIEGELKPRLTAWGFKAGMYWDSADAATRKLIQKVEDIKGPVFDAAGEEIVSAADAARLFVRTKANKWVRVSLDWVKNSATAAYKLATGGVNQVVSYGKELFKKGEAYLNAQDVYTKADTKEPRLRASIMRARGYRSKASPEKVILSPADIDGPVIDLEGNQALSADDIKAGLVDRHGRELVAGKLRLLQFGKDVIHTAFQKVQNGFNMAKDFLSGKWSGFKNWFKVDGIAFSGGKTIIERLTQIRDLLDQRLPQRKRHVIGDVDGDGVREGSYQDEKKKGELHEAHGASAADAVAGAVNSVRNGSKSLYGAIADGVMGLLNKHKKKGVDGEEGPDGGVVGKVEEYGGLAGTALGFLPGGKIARGAWKGVKNLGRFGTKWGGRGLAAGLGAGGDVLRAAGTARAAGQAGFAGTRAAYSASKSAKLAAEAKEAYHALLESGVTHEEAMAALSREAPKGPGILRRLFSGAGTAARGVGTGLGKAYAWNKAGNRMTGSLAKEGAQAAGRGLWAGAKRLPGALAETGKFLGGTAAPWIGKDIAKNAGKFLKFGSGLGAGLGLDVASHIANATGHTTIGKGLDYASDASTGFGLASSAASLAGFDGLAGAGAAILAAVGLPALVLGGGLVAAAGAVGYLGYKAVKYAMETKMTRLSKMRYIQYGFAEKDEDHARAVFQLEGMLEKNVTFSVNGTPQLSNKGLKEEDLLSPFNVDKKNKGQLQNWLKWFTLRFKPIFLTSMAALHKIDPKAKMGNLEDLKANQKKTYIAIASWPGGPYKYMTSPFADLETLPSGDKEVNEYAARMKQINDAEVKNAPDSEKKVIDKPATAPKTVAEIASAAKTAQQIGGPGDKTSWTTLTKNDGSVDNTGVSATGAMITVKGNFDPTHIQEGGMLDGLTSIRMKAYGLQEMNISKVKELLTLENAVQKDVKVDEKGNAVYTGNLAKVFGDTAPMFGVNAPNSKDGTNWLGWFRARFLPTYLNYVTALAKATKINDPRAAVVSLKAQQALDVASAIRGTSGPAGSIWKLSQSPWPDYQMNNDVKSTDVNYNVLESKATKSTFEEAKAQKKSEPTTVIGKAWKALTTDVNGKKNTLGKVADKVSSAATTVWQGAKAAVNAVTKTTTDAATAGSYGAAQGVGIQKQTADSKKIKASLMKAATAAGITNPSELAMFMAQMDVESGGFKSLSENLNYKPDRLKSVFGSKYFISEADAATVAQGGPESIANRVYGGRMGNTSPGDGFKYRGRGVIQLTGKDNYARYGKMTGLDLVNSPDLASDPDNAAKIAIAFWKDKGAAGSAQQGDVKAVTAKINGGQNGLSDREAKYKQYLAQANSGQLAAAAGGSALTAGDKGAGAGKTAPVAGPTGALGAPGASGAGAPAGGAPGAGKGSGAPAGFGGSNPTPNGSAKTAFDSLGGTGKPASAAAPSAGAPTPSATTRSAPKDPFAMPALGPTAAAGQGFGGPRGTDQSAISAANKPAGTAVPDGGIAAQSLAVQKDMLVALQTLVKIAGQGGGAGAGTPGNDQSSMQSTIAQRKNDSRRAQPVQAAIVSLDKPNFQ